VHLLLQKSQVSYEALGIIAEKKPPAGEPRRGRKPTGAECQLVIVHLPKRDGWTLFRLDKTDLNVRLKPVCAWVCLPALAVTVAITTSAMITTADAVKARYAFPKLWRGFFACRSAVRCKGWWLRREGFWPAS
jgi:hypothetical protein